MRTWLQRLVILQGCLIVASALSQQIVPADWMRFPHVTVPRLAQPPTIDGTVDRAEWTGAAALGPLKVGPAGAGDDLQRQVYLAWDDRCLYLAFDLERPHGARQPRIPEQTGRIDNWRAGDNVEIHLAPGAADPKAYYNFCLYANSAFADGYGSPGVDKDWNAEWTQAARVTDLGWQGEAAIPFAALKLDGPPQPGDIVRFDFIDIRRTPYQELAHWSYRGPNWHSYQNFGFLHFAAETPAVRFLQAGPIGKQESLVSFDIVNPTATAQQVPASLQVWQRKPGAAGGAKSYYDSVESGFSDFDPNAGVTNLEGYKGTQLGDTIANALGFYIPLEGCRLDRTEEVPAGERRTVGIVCPGEPAEYLAIYSFAGPEGQPALLQGVTSFVIAPDIRIEPLAYWLYSRVIDVAVDFRKLEVAQAVTLEISLRSKDTPAPIASTVIDVPQGQTAGQGTLPVDGLAVGFYQIEAVIRGADRKEIGRNQVSIERPPNPPWFQTDAGRKLLVPEPYTPMTASADGKVTVWGRTYDLSTVFPASMISQGDEVLAAPVSLDLYQGEQRIAWRVGSLKQTRNDPDRAEYAVVLTSSIGKLTGTMWVEFDGLVWYDLQLVPDGKITIDRGALTMQVTAKHAALLGTHKWLFDPVLNPKPVEPVLKNAPADSGTGGVGGPMADAWLPFSPCVWIGDERAGLAWYAEAPVDWVVKAKTGAGRMLETTAARDGQPAVMIAHLIQEPIAFDRPRRLVFGLQASPMRRISPPEVANVVQWGGPTTNDETYAEMARYGGKTVIYHGGWKGDKGGDWGGYPDFPKDEEGRAALKEAVAMAHKHGIKALIYTGWGVNADAPEWLAFGAEMCRMPYEYAGFRTYRQSAGNLGGYIDYMAWSLARLQQEFGIDGVLYDSTSNLAPDQNLRIGNAWVDDQGRVRPAYAVLGTRELFKRVYRVFHGESAREGVIVNHPGSIWCINSFADIHHRGEGWPMRAPTLRNSWEPIEDYRASYFGIPFGNLPLGMSKNFKRLPMRANNHNAVLLLHGYLCKTSGAALGETQRVGDQRVFVVGVDKKKAAFYGYNDEPQAKLWAARAWLPFDLDTRPFYFFDRQQAVIPAMQSLLSSAFVSADGKRALLVVTNLDPQPVAAVKVTVDPAALGLKAGTLKLHDAVLDQPVPLDGHTFTIDIEPERYRFLKLWSE